MGSTQDLPASNSRLVHLTSLSVLWKVTFYKLNIVLRGKKKSLKVFLLIVIIPRLKCKWILPAAYDGRWVCLLTTCSIRASSCICKLVIQHLVNGQLSALISRYLGWKSLPSENSNDLHRLLYLVLVGSYHFIRPK